MRVLLLLVLAGVLSVAGCSPSGDPPASGIGGASLASPGAAGVAGAADGAGTGIAAQRDGRERAPARLRVVVSASEDGAPLDGVEVSVRSAGPGPDADGGEPAPEPSGERTGADGAVLLALAPGDYVVALDPPGAADARVRLEPGEERRLDLRVPTRADLDVAIDVVADETGAPLAGADVAVLGLPPHARDAVVSARTDAAGRARLRVPSWAPTAAAITASGRGELRLALPPELHGDRARPGGGGAPLPARLARVAELRGRLIDPAGAPVAGVAVVASVAAADLFPAGGGDGARARAGAHGGEPEVVQRATSAADGTFALALPPNAGVLIEAEADEAAGRPARTLEVVRLGAGEAVERELVLRTGTRIEGQLLGPEDVPVAGAPIWLVQGGGRRVFTRFEDVFDRTSSDAEGRFAFLGVEPGSWRVGPAPRRASDAAGLTIAAVPALVDVVPGLQRAEVVLRPPASIFLTGRTVDVDGRPIGGVGLFANSDTQAASGTSEPDGTFRLGPFVAGELRLRTAAGPGIAAGDGRVVQAGDGGLELVVLRTGALRGEVRRGDGSVPSSAEVTLARHEHGRSVGARRLRANVDGEFLVPDADPGSYVVVARAEPGLVAAGAVDVPSEGTARLQLDLAAGARARCRLEERHAGLVYLVLADGLQIERGRVDGRLELTTLEVPAGEVAVELYDASGMVDRRSGTVAGGRVIDLSFLR